MDEQVSMTEDELEQRSAHNQAAGRYAALQGCVSKLFHKAGVLFAEGRDDEAKLVRELARDTLKERDAAQKELEKHIQIATDRRNK